MPEPLPPALSPFEPATKFLSPFKSGGIPSTISKGQHNSGKSTHSVHKPMGSPPSSQGSNSSVYSSSYKQRQVRVMHEHGGSTVFNLDYSLRGWYDYGLYCWPEIAGLIEVPSKHCSFTYDTPKFNACVYNASDDYLQGRWGVKLHSTDKDWLASHPLATDDGIPQADFVTCVHELVAPYDFKVNRVRVAAGSLLLGDHMLKWMGALGCNPFAMADRKTTNAEAAKKMNMTLEEANALWRFEFHSDPLPGSIVGEKGWSNNASTGVKTGSFGGHARYLAPRAKSAYNWFGCIQLERSHLVSYLSEPPAVEYVPRKGEPRLQVSSITDVNGDVIAQPKSGSGYDWTPLSPLIPDEIKALADKSSKPSTPSTSTPVTPMTPQQSTALEPYRPGSRMHEDPDLFTGTDGGKSPTSSVKKGTDNGKNFCPSCTTHYDDGTEMHYGGLMCEFCHHQLWSMGLTCKKCKHTFSPSNPPEPVGYDPGKHEVEWRCPACHEGMAVDLANDSQNEPWITLVSLSAMLYVDEMVRAELLGLDAPDFDDLYLDKQW